MSIRCGADIKAKDIKLENRKELLDLLSQYRPGDEAKIIDNEIVEFPCTFNDDVSGVIIDFMEKYKITTNIVFSIDDEEMILVFNNGTLEEDKDEEE